MKNQDLLLLLYLIISLEENEQKIILPILYNVTPEEVFKMYPELEEIQFIKAIDFDFKDIAIKFSKELIKDLR